MIDKVKLGVLCDWEKKNNKSALELFNKESKSFTDLRDILWLLMVSEDPSVTPTKIEAMTMKEFQEAQARYVSATPEANG